MADINSRLGRTQQLFATGDLELHAVVVGALDNNVFVLRCRRRGEALLIDAANEHERLLSLCTKLGVTRVVETHGHHDHIGAVEAVRAAGIDVSVTAEDAHLLPSYDQIIGDDEVIEVGDLRVRTVLTPGHTMGSMCFEVVGAGLLFSGDTLFPGGPGNTNFGGDFSTIITSVEDRLFRPFDAETVVLPGHGLATTIGMERPHLDEWVARGW